MKDLKVRSPRKIINSIKKDLVTTTGPFLFVAAITSRFMKKLKEELIMCNETIKLIEELELVRLELFRSTASLDYCIEDIRFILNRSENPNFIKKYIKGRLEVRNNMVRVSGWDKLVEKEKEIIQKINNSI